MENLKKQKIIMQAKLRQKEDQITNLNKKIRELQIALKEGGSSKSLESRIKELEEELTRSKKINKSLRTEANSLAEELEQTKKALNEAKKVASTIDNQISPSGIDAESEVSKEELEYLKAQLVRKDEIIARLTEQLEMISPDALDRASGSYMKIRQLNAKIRELKAQVDVAKKSEAAMKERLLELQRKLAAKEDEFNW
ncbi:MAG: hypothetical protein ACTSQP_06280 [Promethearchaeota archaeon]